MQKDKPYIPKESEEAVTFANWLTMKGLKFTHLAQETFTKNWGTRMKNKREGVNPGIPDYVIIIPPRGDCATYNLAFVELKRTKGGVLSPAQKSWIDSLNMCLGVECAVAHGAQEAIDFIESLL